MITGDASVNTLKLKSLRLNKIASSVNIATFVKRKVSQKKENPMKLRKRYKVWLKYNRRCAYCGNRLTIEHGKGNSVEIDHIISVSQGGENNIKNLNPCCRVCNSWKGVMTVNEFRAWLASSSDNMKTWKRYCRIPWNGLFYFENCENSTTRNENNPKAGGKA